jgi:3-phenylpropionate/cinnamic acid dioxygenase small subunit
MAGAITLDRIMAVNAAYIRCIDTGALEAWPDFFLDDCLYKVTTAENHKAGFAAGVIYADSKAMLSDRILALRQANVYEKQNYRHIVGLPNVIKNGGDTAECETPFIVVRIMHDGQSDVFATGVYLDTLRDQGGDLKFAQRLVVCDSSRFDTLVALPL